MKYLIDADYFSSEFSLNDSKGYRLNKNAVGGVLTIIFSMTVFSGVIFFTLQFLNRLNFNVLISSSLSYSFAIANYTKLPFMIRIKQSSVQPFANPEKIVALTVFKYSATTEEEVKNSLLKKVTYNGTQCDINNTSHFDQEFKDLFNSYDDTSTFMCIDYGGDFQDLIGTYGAPAVNQYFTYNISPCVNQTWSNVTCETSQKISTILNDARVDIRTLNYKINSYSKKPEEMIVDNFKFDASNSLNKRIWFNYKSITYSTDSGFIFEDVSISEFFMIDRITIDVSLSDMTQSASTVAYLRITSTNLKEDITYLRSYLKVQNLLANLGGLVKGVAVITNFLCIYLTRDMKVIRFLKEIPSLRYEVFMRLGKKHGMHAQKDHLQMIRSTNDLNSNNNSNAGLSNINIKPDISKLKRDTGQCSLITELSGENFDYPYSALNVLFPLGLFNKESIYYNTLRIAKQLVTHKSNIFGLINKQDMLVQSLEISTKKEEYEVMCYLFDPQNSSIKTSKIFNRKWNYLRNHNSNISNIQATIMKECISKA